jgi:hypothetical protein
MSELPAALAVSWWQVAIVAYLDIGNERPRLALT